MSKSQRAFKIGLFFVTLFWFSFTSYQLADILIKGVELYFTDIPATIGLGFRAAASLIALTTTVLFLQKKLSSTNTLTYFKWIVLFEAAYWLSFLPSGLWGFQYSSQQYSQTFFLLSTGLPCTIAAIILPIALVSIFLKINLKNHASNITKSGLIAASAYLFVFWFNYTAQWWSEIFVSGTSLIWKSRLYSLEFALTVGGLLFLTMVTVMYTLKSFDDNLTINLSLRKAGAIITAFGLFFDLILILWLLFPNSGNALTVWPTFSIKHNADLWMAALPLIGIPLMFSENKNGTIRISK